MITTADLIKPPLPLIAATTGISILIGVLLLTFPPELPPNVIPPKPPTPISEDTGRDQGETQNQPDTTLVRPNEQVNPQQAATSTPPATVGTPPPVQRPQPLRQPTGSVNVNPPQPLPPIQVETPEVIEPIELPRLELEIPPPNAVIYAPDDETASGIYFWTVETEPSVETPGWIDYYCHYRFYDGTESRFLRMTYPDGDQGTTCKP